MKGSIMTAADYFENFEELVKAHTLEGSREPVDLMYEAFKLEFTLWYINQKKTPTYKKFIIFINELNDKWNNLRTMFMDKLKFTIMQRDEFINRFKVEYPKFFNTEEQTPGGQDESN